MFWLICLVIVCSSMIIAFCIVEKNVLGFFGWFCVLVNACTELFTKVVELRVIL